MKRRNLLQTAPELIYAPGLALAQTAYPFRPIRYTERWGNLLRQNSIVDNQRGGDVIASQATARAAPDGYTLMQGYVATNGISPATRKLP